MKAPTPRAPTTHISISDIAAALGVSIQAARKRARKQCWPFHEESTRGGQRRLYAINALPADVREKLLDQRIAQIQAAPLAVGTAPAVTPEATTKPLATAAQTIASRDGDGFPERLAGLAGWQTECAIARVALLDEVEHLAREFGVWKAMRQIEARACAGTLPEHLQSMVLIANARAGKGGRTLSRDRLRAWRELAAKATTPEQCMVLLAPKSPGRDYTLAEDVAAVLALYQRPNKPSLRWCVRQVAKQFGYAEDALDNRVRRFMQKVPSATFYPGRHTGAALKALQPFRRRDFLSLHSNEVWVGDGHGAKLKVAHPETGSPFVPEVTAIMDVADRYVVGWSVSLSENRLAVTDALRHGVSRNGVPLMYYTDNGGGQKNEMLDAPVTGILGSLNIHHGTGRPGNPQGRGVIERFWQTVLIPLAKRFATYQGRGADRDTLKKVSGQIDRKLRAARRGGGGEALALPAKLPTWQEFIAALAAAIEDYNQHHRHRSLPKLDGRHHATPAEYRAVRLDKAKIEQLPSAELASLFMPSAERKAQRGEVRLLNGIYFHEDLMLVDGQSVKVGYDIHDNSRVWVRRLSGELICEALLDGNRSGYQPKSLMDDLRQKRAQRRMQLLQGKAAEVRAELRGGAPLEREPGNFLSMRLVRPEKGYQPDAHEQSSIPTREEIARYVNEDAARKRKSG